MRFFGSLFHPPPSAEYTRPNLTNIQHVYKRIFDHLVERGDSYKRDAFSGLETARDHLPEEVYLRLRVDHDALSIQRDVLADGACAPSTELLSKANSYKNSAKTLYWAVQSASENDPASPSTSSSSSMMVNAPCSSPNSYRESLHHSLMPPPIPYVTRSTVTKTTERSSEDPERLSALRLEATQPAFVTLPALNDSHVQFVSLDPRTEEDLEGVKFPVPMLCSFEIAEEPLDRRTPDLQIWLDNALGSLDHSVDISTVKSLLLSIPPEQMDAACRRSLADMMTDYGHVDGESFMEEFVLRRSIRTDVSRRSSTRSISSTGHPALLPPANVGLPHTAT